MFFFKLCTFGDYHDLWWESSSSTDWLTAHKMWTSKPTLASTYYKKVPTYYKLSTKVTISQSYFFFTPCYLPTVPWGLGIFLVDFCIRWRRAAREHLGFPNGFQPTNQPMVSQWFPGKWLCHRNGWNMMKCLVEVTWQYISRESWSGECSAIFDCSPAQYRYAW